MISIHHADVVDNSPFVFVGKIELSLKNVVLLSFHGPTSKRGEGVGGGNSHGRDFFKNESLKVAFVEHLKTIF